MGVEREEPKGPYIVWHDNGGDGWSFDNFATLKEAVASNHGYSYRYVVTRVVDYEVIDKTPLTDGGQ